MVKTTDVCWPSTDAHPQHRISQGVQECIYRNLVDFFVQIANLLIYGRFSRKLEIIESINW